MFVGQGGGGTLDAFNRETEEKLGTLAGHSGTVRPLVLSGGKLCSASSVDRTIMVWA